MRATKRHPGQGWPHVSPITRDLAVLTKLIRHRFGHDQWPVNVSQTVDGTLGYDASPESQQRGTALSRTDGLLFGLGRIASGVRHRKVQVLSAPEGRHHEFAQTSGPLYRTLCGHWVYNSIATDTDCPDRWVTCPSCAEKDCDPQNRRRPIPLPVSCSEFQSVLVMQPAQQRLRDDSRARIVPNRRRAGAACAEHFTRPAHSSSASRRAVDAAGSRPRVASARSHR
jgi:hypothetical protein